MTPLSRQTLLTTALVGGLAMVRWPGKVPSGVITEQALTAHDWYKTFAALAGASDKVPTDRPMDGLDASAFLLGKSETTGREVVVFFGPDGSLMSVKWRNIKIVLRYCEGIARPIVTPQFPMVYDLGIDPGEHFNLFNTRLDMGLDVRPCLRGRRRVREERRPVPQHQGPARSSPGTRRRQGHEQRGLRSSKCCSPASRATRSRQSCRGAGGGVSRPGSQGSCDVMGPRGMFNECSMERRRAPEVVSEARDFHGAP